MKHLMWRRAAALFLALALTVGLMPAALAAGPDTALTIIQQANDDNNFDYEYTNHTVKADKNGTVHTSFDKPTNTSNNAGAARNGAFYAAILPEGKTNAGDVRYVRLSESGGKLHLTYFRDGCTSFRVMIVQPQPDGGDTKITANPTSIIHYTSRGDSYTYTVKFTATLDMSSTLAQIADLNRDDKAMDNLTFTAHIRLPKGLSGQTNSVKLTSNVFKISDSGITPNPGSENGFDIQCELLDKWKDTETGETLPQKLQQKMTFEGTATITGGQIRNMVNAGQNAIYVVGWNSIEKIPDRVLGGTKIQVPAVTCAVPISVVDNSGGHTGGDDDSSGTSSGSSGRYYQVEVQPADNGSVESSHDRARRGTRVTVTVAPDSGYRVGSLTVTDKDGDPVTVRDNGDGTYTFTMPSSEVEVTANFVRNIADPYDTGVSDLLNTTEHMAYMVGDNHGNFRPDASITRAEVTQIFYRLLLDQNVETTVSFSDVAADAWYADAVHALASLGIVNGVGGGQFAPNRQITRAEFAAIMARFAHATSGTVTFTDVPTSHWAYGEISTAAAYGWVNGVGGGRFAPERLITRAEAATMVNRMLGRLCDQEAIDNGGATWFPDVTDAHWAWYDIGEATTDHDYTMGDGEEDWKV